MNRVEQLKRVYALEPHPEGGCFSEVYTAPDSTSGGRPLAGSIYFLLAGAERSHLHVIDCDEVWYYHEGCGLRVTTVDAEGRVGHVDLGPELDAGQRAMAVIPRGVAFGAENLDPAGYTFVSCMTTPQFTYEGFDLLDREALRRLCPGDAGEAERLIPDP